MITNPAPKVYQSISSLPEIKSKQSKTSTSSGMMSPLLKKSKTSSQNSSIEKEPLFIIAKITQRIKKDRQEIVEARNAT
tara:strand:- start:297 stop:533 length:237 start_codon:yes stop_codon:yes gene_type:complete